MIDFDYPALRVAAQYFPHWIVRPCAHKVLRALIPGVPFRNDDAYFLREPVDVTLERPNPIPRGVFCGAHPHRAKALVPCSAGNLRDPFSIEVSVVLQSTDHVPLVFSTEFYEVLACVPGIEHDEDPQPIRNDRRDFFEHVG